MARASALGDAKRRERAERPKTSPELDVALRALLPKAKSSDGDVGSIRAGHQMTKVGSVRLADAGVATSPSGAKSKGGRPLAKDADKALMRIKPWEAEGMSRASWYRRQGEKREQGK